jgi:hypothetical protein
MRCTPYFRFSLTTCLLLFVAADVAMVAQTESPSKATLPLKAAVVLTPEFCATRMTGASKATTKGGFEVGKAACVELEPALKEVFASLTSVSEMSQTGDAQLILIPKFVDVGATTAVTAFSNRELDVFLQWTAKDISGTTIWVETVQGSAKHHMGNVFTYKKNLTLITNDAVKDLASQSASKMSSSEELRKLSH